MLLTAELVRQTRAVEVLKDPSPAVMAVLRSTITSLTIRLQAHIVKDKLSGQVLNVVSGRLRRAIQMDVQATSDSVIGRVFVSGDVKYARIHEYGGVTRAHVIMPKAGAVLAFKMGGRTVFARRVNHPGSKMPQRSYMRSALDDFRDMVRTEVLGAMQQAVTG